MTDEDALDMIHYLKENTIVFISLDLEHGGPECGIIKLLVQIFRLNGFF